MRILPCVLVLCVAGIAHADYSKAWNAAKTNLPATTRAIAMLDLSAFDKSPPFQRLLKIGLAAERELREFDTEVKQLCKLDLVKTIEGAIAAGDPDKGQIVIYLQLATDRAKASACFEALMSKKSGEKVALKQEGIYTVFSSKDGKRSAYAAWPAPNVVAFTFDPENKPALATWVGRGGFSSSPVAPLLTKTDPKAIAAGAVVFTRALDRNIPVMSGFGHVLKNGDNLTALFVGMTADAPSATKGGAELDKEIRREKARTKLAPSIRNILASMKVGAKGNEIRLEILGTVKDLADAIEAETTKRDKPVEAPLPPPP